MKIHVVWSGLAASALMLVTGAAFSGGSPVVNRLMSFDPANGHLMGYPPSGSLTEYLHDGTTIHAKADLSKFLPPDPCIPLAEAWNATVDYDDKRGVTSTFVFEALLSFMSDLQCSADVTSISGTPAPITVISPTH